MSNSYVLPYDPSTVNWSSADDKPLYTRNGGANQMYLQERMALLEGGEAAVVLSSGVAALSGTFFSLLKSGDHVIFSDVTYIAVYRLLNELFNNKFEVETTILDTSDLDAIKKAIKPVIRRLKLLILRRLQKLLTSIIFYCRWTIHSRRRLTRNRLNLARI